MENGNSTIDKHSYYVTSWRVSFYRYTLVQATDSTSGDWDLNAGETVQLQRHVAVVVVMVWWCWGW